MRASNSVERLAPAADDPTHIAVGRQRLLKAAVKVLRRNSYNSTSVGDLAREAGISVGAVYLYIKTKSDIFVLLINDVVDDYKGRVLDADLGGENPTERLQIMTREYFAILDHHRAKTEIMYHEFGSIEPDARSYMRQVEEQLHEAFAGIIRDGIEAGEFAPVDPDLYARNLMWLGHLWALNRGDVRSAMNIDAFTEAQLTFILATLSAK